jgi:hypothetical protein
MLSVAIKLIIRSVVMLNVVLLSVVAPFYTVHFIAAINGYDVLLTLQLVNKFNCLSESDNSAKRPHSLANIFRFICKSDQGQKLKAVQNFPFFEKKKNQISLVKE